MSYVQAVTIKAGYGGWIMQHIVFLPIKVDVGHTMKSNQFAVTIRDHRLMVSINDLVYISRIKIDFSVNG